VEGAPDPTVLHPVSGHERVVFLKPLVTDPRIEVGDYTYYDDDDVERLLSAAWWDWPVELVTEHARTIMAGSEASTVLDRPPYGWLIQDRRRHCRRCATSAFRRARS
jgi:hypothetical protein